MVRMTSPTSRKPSPRKLKWQRWKKSLRVAVGIMSHARQELPADTYAGVLGELMRYRDGDVSRGGATHTIRAMLHRHPALRHTIDDFLAGLV